MDQQDIARLSRAGLDYCGYDLGVWWSRAHLSRQRSWRLDHFESDPRPGRLPLDSSPLFPHRSSHGVWSARPSSQRFRCRPCGDQRTERPLFGDDFRAADSDLGVALQVPLLLLLFQWVNFYGPSETISFNYTFIILRQLLFACGGQRQHKRCLQRRGQCLGRFISRYGPGAVRHCGGSFTPSLADKEEPRGDDPTEARLENGPSQLSSAAFAAAHRRGSEVDPDGIQQCIDVESHGGRRFSSRIQSVGPIGASFGGLQSEPRHHRYDESPWKHHVRDLHQFFKIWFNIMMKIAGRNRLWAISAPTLRTTGWIRHPLTFTWNTPWDLTAGCGISTGASGTACATWGKNWCAAPAAGFSFFLNLQPTFCWLIKKIVSRRRPGSAGDNCCHCNAAALKTMTNLDEKDILCISFHNSIYEVWLVLFFQFGGKLITIFDAVGALLRGGGPQDVLHSGGHSRHAVRARRLDGPVGRYRPHFGGRFARWLDGPQRNAPVGHLRPPPTGQERDPQTGLCSGDFYCASFKPKILKMTFYFFFQKYPTYHLVITGHSLGAGAAVLLSMLLKPRYPKVRCFAFSPPGGLLSKAAARFTETFCLSVIVGDDLVPRLSLDTLESLKRQMILELEMCRHPKVKRHRKCPSFHWD